VFRGRFPVEMWSEGKRRAMTQARAGYSKELDPSELSALLGVKEKPFTLDRCATPLLKNLSKEII
jgi:hypothetical protein